MYTGMKWAAIAAIATVSLAATGEESWAQRGRRGGWGGRGGSGWSVGVGPGGVYAGYNQGGFGNRGWNGNRNGWYGNRNGWNGNRGGWYGNRGWSNGYYGGNTYYPSYGYNNGYYTTTPNYSYGGTVYSSTPSYNSGSSVATNAPPMRTGSSGDVVITNSENNGTALNYSLNGNNYTIQPGQTQRISNDRQWVVEFDRGSGDGTARYSLSEGTFKFKSTDSGWELVRAAEQAATTRSTAKPPLPDPTLQPELNSLDAAPEPKP